MGLYCVQCTPVWGVLVSVVIASCVAPLSVQTGPPRQKQKKRINLRDLSFYLEQERETRKSQLLYKTLSK